jgi:hypothetical protein
MKENINRRKYIYGKFGGHCAYCGKEISIKDMQVDHMHPKRSNGANGLENLMPSCRRCNHYKRANTLASFRKLLITIHERIINIYIVKVAIDYGVIKVIPFDGRFYFEKLADKFYK